MQEDIVEKFYKNYKKEIEQGLRRRVPGSFVNQFEEWGLKNKLNDSEN